MRSHSSTSESMRTVVDVLVGDTIFLNDGKRVGQHPSRCFEAHAVPAQVFPPLWRDRAPASDPLGKMATVSPVRPPRLRDAPG
jgi:hypothetical protein